MVVGRGVYFGASAGGLPGSRGVRASADSCGGLIFRLASFPKSRRSRNDRGDRSAGLKPGRRSSQGVEIDEDIAGLGAFARADVAAGFEDVQDAGGAGVAEAEAALEERGAGLSASWPK